MPLALPGEAQPPGRAIPSVGRCRPKYMRSRVHHLPKVEGAPQGTSVQVPFDDEALERRVVELALTADRQALLTAIAPSGPAFYFLFSQPRSCARTPEWDVLIGPFSTGSRPLYVGAATDMVRRLARYRSRESLGGAKGVPIGRIWVAIVPTRTHAGAKFGEAVWLPFCPWNRPELAGCGSRVQGAPRRGQRVQPWARCWPRPWDQPATPAAVAATRLAMAARAVEPGPPGLSWVPLPLAEGSSSSRPAKRRPAGTPRPA